MPIATVIILVIASVLGFFSAKMHGRFVDIEKSKKVRDEMGALRKQMFEAKRKGDKKTYAKLQREQSQVWGQYSGIMKGQMRVMMYTMVPFFIIYIILMLFIITIVPYRCACTTSPAESVICCHHAHINTGYRTQVRNR